MRKAEETKIQASDEMINIVEKDEDKEMVMVPKMVLLNATLLLAAPALQTIVRPPMRSPRSESTRRRRREGEERVGFG